MSRGIGKFGLVGFGHVVIITAVIVERRSQAEVARNYGVSEGWVSKWALLSDTEPLTSSALSSRWAASSPVVPQW